MTWVERADRVGRWLETAFVTITFALLLLLASSQIFLRNVFSSGLVWADELVRITVLWLAIGGAVAASRDQRHIAIEVLVRSLDVGWQRIVRASVNLFAFLVSGAFAWYSWQFVSDSRQFGDVLLGDWPAWIFQLVMPIGFLLIAYRFLVCAVGYVLRDH